MSDIIDKIRYEAEPKSYTREEIQNAYKIVFKGPHAETVIRDLINHTGFGTNAIAIEPNIDFYHRGMRAILDHIKDVINTPITHEDQEQDTNDSVFTGLIQE